MSTLWSARSSDSCRVHHLINRSDIRLVTASLATVRSNRVRCRDRPAFHHHPFATSSPVPNPDWGVRNRHALGERVPQDVRKEPSMARKQGIVVVFVGILVLAFGASTKSFAQDAT